MTIPIQAHSLLPYISVNRRHMTIKTTGIHKGTYNYYSSNKHYLQFLATHTASKMIIDKRKNRNNIITISKYFTLTLTILMPQ